MRAIYLENTYVEMELPSPEMRKWYNWREKKPKQNNFKD